MKKRKNNDSIRLISTEKHLSEPSISYLFYSNLI